MEKLFIYPANNTENQYINLQEKAIRLSGVDVTYLYGDFFSTKYYLLNWYETLGGNCCFDFVKKILKLFIAKLFCKKIYWVVHNKRPHLKYDDNSFLGLSILLMKILLRLSTKIIILCDETENVLKTLCHDKSKYQDKIFKIPHPNYVNVYKSNNVITESDSEGERLRFLYIGQINRYKNVDLLIDIFNKLETEPVSLYIAGNCRDENYINDITNRIKNNNIYCDFRFIPDDEIVSLISQNDILVLPYSLESTLNSGTIFLAFSNKKTVISPMIGTLLEYKNKDFFYGYNYNSESEHADNLFQEICHVIHDYCLNADIIVEKGFSAYSEVVKNNSIEYISSLYRELLSSL